MTGTTLKVAIALAIALAASILGNLWLGREWLAARDRATTAESQRSQAQAVASSCSASVQQLEDAAREREREAKRMQEAARSQALGHQQNAQRILASPPAVPGDTCASAGAAIDAWLQGRAQK